MNSRAFIIFGLLLFGAQALAQKKPSVEDIIPGKWSLTKYTETNRGETLHRKINGVSVYQPNTHGEVKEIQQLDSIGVYDFSANTFTFTSKVGTTVGKWHHSETDSMITLFDHQKITDSLRCPSKSTSTFDLRLIQSQRELFLVLISYDKDFETTHKLYYKKDNK